ncbi:hypothetical protein CR203_19620 [Salipaludibacillus neizhouensis]|uniref:Uncharacterized protein n=1 Tax=Salipaludibacillus neizhouensis TaxID=885475 RepID=A0A3A9JYW9_9BACI|nr:hypothetical protein [Salipaludibacillus neizhouensis]RKL65687.1 hypothetical protein CR203_19620 [Salipaludibacillus neizhouensis]
MDKHINELSTWLESHTGETVFIQKGELSTGLKELFDIDRVTFQLEHFSIESNEDTFDDYISSKELVLHGNGIVQITETEEKQLPQNIYEIPLNGKIVTSSNKKNLKVETENAVYDIQVQ